MGEPCHSRIFLDSRGALAQRGRPGGCRTKRTRRCPRHGRTPASFDRRTLIETFFGLARLGHTDSKGIPGPLQPALSAQEFRDVLVFRAPPRLIQRMIFGALAPIARGRGYRATYPQLQVEAVRSSDSAQSLGRMTLRFFLRQRIRWSEVRFPLVLLSSIFPIEQFGLVHFAG
jgi:hypothetical protein